MTHTPITTGVCGDGSPPTWPAGSTLTASPSSPTTVALTWTAATDNIAVVGYRVYRGGSLIATTTATSHQDTTATTGATYAYQVQAFDEVGNVSLNGPTATGQTLPTLTPSAIYRTTVTDIASSTEFLWKGASKVQFGVADGTIEYVRAAVVRGKVVTRDGVELSGVEVTVEDHPELGRTYSRSDGLWDMAVNAGSVLSLKFAKPGYPPAYRKTSPRWREHAVVADVAMVGFDTAVTELETSSSTSSIQVARATTQIDASGTRRPTLLLNPGTTASIPLPGGGSSTPSAIHFRATEFTVGPNGPTAMPADLPPNSAYTFALELSTDESVAAGSNHTNLSQPAILYVENFLGFPVGENVPVGTYDETKKAWVPESNGRVIKIISIVGGAAQIDTNGDGVADSTATLAALGITSGEQTTLASLYSAGATLWRVSLSHFSSVDLNWAPTCGPTCIGPNAKTPEEDRVSCSAKAIGSIIECENQVLAEQVPIAGTPHALRYQSDRVPGRRDSYETTLRLTPPAIPSALKRVELTWSIAGRKTTQVFSPSANLTASLSWDGLDVYGRMLQGVQHGTAQIDYVYDGLYERVPLFGSYGTVTYTTVPSRTEVRRSQLGIPVTFGTFDAREVGLGGWSLTEHHVYDYASKTLFMGNGARRDTDALGSMVITSLYAPAVCCIYAPADVITAADGTIYFTWAGQQVYRMSANGGDVTHVAGRMNDGTTTEGGLATQFYFSEGRAQKLAIAADGSLYVGGGSPGIIWRIGTDGIIRRFAGPGPYRTPGDGGPALNARFDGADMALGADGNLYIADWHYGIGGLRRVDPRGIISTIVGGFPATAVAIGPDGSLYVGSSRDDSGGARIRRVDTSGRVTFIAGGGTAHEKNAEGVPATNALITHDIRALTVDRDGTVIASEGHRVFTVASDGILRRIAGSWESGGAYAPPGINPNTYTEGGSPYDLWLGLGGLALAGDGSLIVTDDRIAIRKLSSSLPGARATDIVVPSSAGKELYVFNAAGRHLRTVDTVTMANLWAFGYDGAGRLASVTDVDGNVTSFEHDASGKPTGILGPFGQRTVLTVDSNGFLDSVKDPSNAITAFTSSASGLLASMTDARSKTWSFTYDTKGRLVRDDDPAGGYKTLTRTQLGTNDWQVALATRLGATKTYKVEHVSDGSEKRTYIAPNSLVTTSSTNPAATSTNAQPTGMVSAASSSVDPRFGLLSPVHSSTMNTPGGLSNSIASSRSALRNGLALPLGSDPLSFTQLIETTHVNGGSGAAGGSTFTSVYDTAPRRWTFTSSTSPARTSTMTLTATSKVAQTKLDGLTPIDYGYDARGRLTSITQGTRVTTLGYGIDGFLSSVTDPLLRTTSFEHDAVGRVTKQIFPDTREVSMSYDTVGNLASVTPPGRPAHAMTYSPVSQMASYDPPVLADVAAPSTTYEYDFDRKLTRINRPDGVVVSYGYDATGRRSSITHQHDTITFDYDATKGTLSTVSTPSVTMTYVYDGALRKGTTWSGAIAGSVAHTFDNRFRVATEAVNGATPVSFGYDADGLLTSAGGLTLTRGTHGMVTATSQGVVTETVTYNALGELESRTSNVSGADLLKLTYTRDLLGRILTKTEVSGGATKVYEYRYDSVGRLDQVKTDAVITATYAYDSNGNRLSKTTSAGVESGTYDGQDRMLTYGGATYAYNANGDLTSKTDSSGTTTYEYDALGNLRKVTPPTGSVIEYVIDGANRRAAKKVGGTLMQQFLYSSDLRIVAELNGAGAVVSRFVYGSRVNVPEYIVKGSSTYRVVTDHLGSVRKVVDTSSGAVAQAIEYDEFGVGLSDSAPGFQPFGFAGGLNGDGGFVRFNARDLDPRSGRWTTREPLRFEQTTSLYDYAASDPINYQDYDGLSFEVAADTEDDFVAAYLYLEKVPNFKKMIDALEKSPHKFVLKKSATNGFNPATNEILWNPCSALVLPGGKKPPYQSPALGLLHETGHAFDFATKPNFAALDKGYTDETLRKRWRSPEERHVIEDIEGAAALLLGEPIRASHGGVPGGASWVGDHRK